MKKEQLKMEINIEDFELLQKSIELPRGYLLTRFKKGLEDSTNRGNTPSQAQV